MEPSLRGHGWLLGGVVRLRGEIIWFAIGGGLGFLIDAGVVQTLVRALEWNPYAARVVSFLLAASFTWWWNRTFTFACRRRHRASTEWARWLAVMLIGATVNYGLYALLVSLFPLVRAWPVLGVAVGSAAAAAVNFIGARKLVFGNAKSTL